MYGSQENIRHNLRMFFIDGMSFMPSMALISVSAVIPYFLDQLDASTFHIALATSMPLICVLLTQPFFGQIASRAKVMNKTFSKILIIQRLSLLVFILLMPVFSGYNAALVNAFLIFWCIFNIFVGSYGVFFTPLVIRLLPPDKRGGFRGIGMAIGSFLGVGMSALIPVILGNIAFPYNYMTIFSLGLFFLLVNACIFYFMRQSDDFEPNEPMSMTQYIKKMPSTIKENAVFRAMILTGIFLAVPNAILPYYTLYAIRGFFATETHIAILTGLAIMSGAIAYIVFGYIIDRRGSRIVAAISACLLVTAGVLIITTNSLYILFAAWVLANMCNTGTMVSISLIFGEVAPPTKLPLYVGVYMTISMALSAGVVLLLAPVLERFGFAPIFATVLLCGLLSLTINIFVLRKRMANLRPDQHATHN